MKENSLVLVCHPVWVAHNRSDYHMLSERFDVVELDSAICKKHPILMTRKEYEIEYSWTWRAPMPKMSHRTQLQAERDLNIYHNPDRHFDMYWDYSYFDYEKGFALWENMHHLDRIAVEAVIQHRSIELVLSFANSLTGDTRDYFIVAYNRAILYELKHEYDKGYNKAFNDYVESYLPF